MIHPKSVFHHFVCYKYDHKFTYVIYIYIYLSLNLHLLSTYILSGRLLLSMLSSKISEGAYIFNRFIDFLVTLMLTLDSSEDALLIFRG